MKKGSKKTTTATTVRRTTEGLRTALFDELDALRSGKSAPARANAVAKTSLAIIATAKLELEYEKLNLVLLAHKKRGVAPSDLLLSNGH